MAVNVPNPGSYQAQLGQHCVNLRMALQALLNDSAYLTSMGGTAFLTAAQPNGLGLSSVDATNIMNIIGGVTPTNATVQSLQTWINSSQPLWGGQ